MNEAALARKRFLLIEDDDDHAELITRTLSREAVAEHVDRAKDGEEGLAFLRGEEPFGDRVLPDLILLDLKLPKLDGLELLGIIKADDALAQIPVVVLTTSAAERDRTRAYANHVNSYVVKPMSFIQFQQMVKDLSAYWGQWNSPPPD